MPVRFLSHAQREQLSGFPAGLEPDSLDRFFALSGPDLAEVRPRHGVGNRLGWPVQLPGLRLVRPGLSVSEQSLVGAAREAAREETAARVAHLATPGRCRSLDGLLQVDPELGAARATWLRRLAVQASPPAMHDEMDKVVFLRGLGAGEGDLGTLPAKRVAAPAPWAPATSHPAPAPAPPGR